MESSDSRDLAKETSGENQELEPKKPRVSAADLQHAHTRVTARLGDVACEDRDTVTVEFE